MATAGVSVNGAIPQEKVERGKKRGCRKRRTRREWSRGALQDNINREEMKQQPHFFFAYSFCLPPGIDNITPDIFVTPFNCLTGDEAHTQTDANTGGTEQVVCLLSFILRLAENCCAFRKMSRP